MIETTMARPLLALLHVSDSLFPIGGFGYSDGLEAATAAGLVETPADRGRGADGWCRRSRNKRRIDSARRHTRSRCHARGVYQTKWARRKVVVAGVGVQEADGCRLSKQVSVGTTTR